jgi:hypothetical protein
MVIFPFLYAAEDVDIPNSYPLSAALTLRNALTKFELVAVDAVVT